MNYSNYRICLQTNLDPLKSLFESFKEDQELSELYKYCTGIIVLPLDSYTTSICTNCESSLISCFEFRVRNIYLTLITLRSNN